MKQFLHGRVHKLEWTSSDRGVNKGIEGDCWASDNYKCRWQLQNEALAYKKEKGSINLVAWMEPVPVWVQGWRNQSADSCSPKWKPTYQNFYRQSWLLMLWIPMYLRLLRKYTEHDYRKIIFQKYYWQDGSWALTSASLTCFLFLLYHSYCSVFWGLWWQDNSCCLCPAEAKEELQVYISYPFTTFSGK